MYELVKQKSWGIRILTGLAIFFVIAQVLKMLLHGPTTTIDEDLMKIASEINKSTPIMIDSTTRFDNVVALPNNRIQYNYTFLKTEKSTVDTAYLQEFNRKVIINKMRTGPEMKVFVDNQVDIIAKYYDQDGLYICTVYISHNDYKK